MEILNRLRAALPKRERVPDPPGVTVKQWQVQAAFAASWVAFSIAAFFLGAYCLEVAGDRASSLHVTHAGTWVGDLIFYIPLVIGFLMLSLGIPFLAKNVITWFVALSWRESFWPKMWALVLAIGVSFAIILGSFSTMGGAIVERGREHAVAVEQTQQEAAVLTARIGDAQHRLDEMTRSESQYIRTASSMAPAAYDAFVEARRGDWQYDRLKSYRAQSVEAAGLRDQITELRAQQARQTTVAAVTATPETAETGWVIDLLAWVKGAWAIILSVLNDIACLFMGLIAYALQLKRERQLAFAAPREESDLTAIPDLRDQPRVPTQLYEVETKMFDEEGNELVARRATFAKKPKKREKAQATFAAPDLPDEPGFTDARSPVQATAAEFGVDPSLHLNPTLDLSAEPVPERVNEQVGHEGQGGHDGESDDLGGADHTPEPTMSLAEAEEILFAEEAPAAEPAKEDETRLPNNEGVMVRQDERELADAK